MAIDKKILEEVSRFNSINKYITEQDATLPPPPAEDPMADPMAELPPLDPAAQPAPEVAPTTPPAPQPVDVAQDPEVEKVGEEESKKEELEITDLVKSQKNVEEKQEEYFQQLFSHLTDLENRLGDMDNIVNKLNDLEAKIEKYREKTPEEKLQLRSLDSGPYNQKLSDFFNDNQDKFEQQGKDEYILTKDEVEDFSPHEIKKSFRNYEEEDDDNKGFMKI
jgi:hypothetical protein